MNLQFNHVKSWGKDRFYPLNREAIFITSLVNKKTLTKKQIKSCINFGWDVKVNSKPVDI